MPKIKTSELTEAALDWAVATCQGLPIQHDPMGFGPHYAEGGYWIWDDAGPLNKRDYRLIGRQYSPSTIWSQGGPIIERKGIGLFFDRACGNRWRATHPVAPCYLHASALIAAMRCYVASELGDEVEIPEKLL